MRTILRAGAGSILVAAALIASGCISIKSQGLTQSRAPGVVTIGGVICGSDYDQSSYPRCDNSNVAEVDSRPPDATGCTYDADGVPGDSNCPGLAGDGQIFAAFRVPIGSEGPERFDSDAKDITFTRNDSLSAALEAAYPAADKGQHWVGYVSGVRTFKNGVDAEFPTGIHPEFTLPETEDGGPYLEPYRWRWAAGFRKIAAANAGDPVSCDSGGCLVTPPAAVIPNDLPATKVSDFGVLGGGSVNVQQTRTATVTFPVNYEGAVLPGATELALSVKTDMPGGAPSLSTQTIAPLPNSKNSVTVTLPVPLSTPEGKYTVTVTASIGSPAVTRSNTATVVVGPPPDSDGDTLADPFDKCPNTPRGLFDADRDGCVGPYQEIAGSVSGGWSVSNKGLLIGSLTLKRLPAGATVQLVCKACKVNKTLTGKGTDVALKPLRNKLLRRNKSFTLRTTAPGFIGEELTLKVKKYGKSRKAIKKAARNPFTRTRKCIPVGATTPAATCSATPPTGP